MNRQILGSAALAIFVAAASAPVSADMFARVSGRVTDASGLGVRTIVTVSDSSGRTFDVPTDRGGRFSAIGLQPGAVVVQLNVEGFALEQTACAVAAGESGRFDLVAQPERGKQTVDTVRVFSGTADMRARFDAQSDPPKQDCSIEPSTVDQYVIQ